MIAVESLSRITEYTLKTAIQDKCSDAIETIGGPSRRMMDWFGHPTKDLQRRKVLDGNEGC